MSELERLRKLSAEMYVALDAMLDIQSARRHPLGQPDEGIAYSAAAAAAKARNAIAKYKEQYP